MNLSAQLRQRGHEAIAQAYVDYAELIKRGGKTTNEDVEAMQKCMELLGVTTSEIDADLKAWQSFPGLRRRAATAREFEREVVKANKSLAAKREELKTLTAEIEGEIRTWRGEAMQAARQLDAAKNAAAQITRLTERHWRLSAAPSPHPAAVGGRWHPQEIEAWLAHEPPMVAFPFGESDSTRPVHRQIAAAGYFKSSSLGVWKRKGVKDAPLPEMSLPDPPPALAAAPQAKPTDQTADLAKSLRRQRGIPLATEPA
jgi:hypothetical protein